MSSLSGSYQHLLPARTLDACLAMVSPGHGLTISSLCPRAAAHERGQYEFAEQETTARKVGCGSTPEST